MITDYNQYKSPIVLIEFNFLKKLWSQFDGKIISNEHNIQYFSFLIELLSDSIPFIDIDFEQIHFNISQVELNEKYLPEFSFIIKMFNNNLIQTIKFDKENDYITTVETYKPNYMLLDCSEEEAIRLRKKLGVIILNSEFKESEMIYKVILYHLKDNFKNNFSEKFKKLVHTKEVIIEDKYLFNNVHELSKFESNTNNKKYNLSLDKLINSFAISKEIKYHFKIIYYHDSTKIEYNVVDIVKELFKKTSKNMTIDIYQVDKTNAKKMHDRHIYSDTFWITSNHSFMDEYITQTEWISKPIGLYYSKFIQRRNFLEKNIINGIVPITLKFNM